MKPVNVLVIRFNLSELYERLFYGRFEWCMCVSNWKQAEYGCSKANSALSHIWLKTKLRIHSEILRIDPESLERESRWINFSFLPPLMLDHFHFTCNRTTRSRQTKAVLKTFPKTSPTELCWLSQSAFRGSRHSFEAERLDLWRYSTVL